MAKCKTKGGKRKYWMLALAGILAIPMVGCRTAGGKAESVHYERHYSTNGTLISDVYSRDRNYMGVKGLLASDEASGLTYTRSNFLGSAQTTTAGKVMGKPESDAIKAVGDSVGSAAGAILNKAVKP